MNHLIRTIAAALIIGVCGASLASAQTQRSISVPAAQRALTNILAKYDDLYRAAPNDIQEKNVVLAFATAFCAAMPSTVSGWIGTVEVINDDTPHQGIVFVLEVSTYGPQVRRSLENVEALALGSAITLGTTYGYGVSDDANPPFAVGSSLYNAASTLRIGDTVVFSGRFPANPNYPNPSRSPALQACYENLVPSMGTGEPLSFPFAFSSIRKIGSDLTLE